MAIDYSVPQLEDSIPKQIKAKAGQGQSTASNIIDIRRDQEELDLLEALKNGLRPSSGGLKSIPTLLLYDEAGLGLFERITYLEEYYLTNAEIEVLERYADHIANRIPPDSVVLELGSGNLRKIRILLDAFEKAKKAIQYFALDVSSTELQRTLSEIPPNTFKYVECFGLHGTYDDGLEWLQSSQIAKRPKTILSLGSSIGNFDRAEGAEFLKSFASVLQPGDALLIGMDGCKDSDRVYHAYNDKQGITHEFVLNGLLHANRLLGFEAFDIAQWSVIGEYDHENGRHHAFVSPDRDVEVDGVKIVAHERVFIEQSFKYSELDRQRLWEAAEVTEGATWFNSRADYGLHMAYKSNFEFASAPEKYAANTVPSLHEWNSLWTAWDTVTQEMIPEEELLSKPIKLRNACIFYLGHIPTFLAIHLQKASGRGPEGLQEYQKIFERGIDPDVDNPDLCHDHSEIPDVWPSIQEILQFQDRVRAFVKEFYASNSSKKNHAVGKALWIGFEHEIMHLETLLYMLIQSEKTLAPQSAVRPDFEALAQASKARTVPNQWFEIPARTITLGMDDDDADCVSTRYFGWDNEKPQRKAHVRAFTVQARPITNGEYAHFLHASGSSKLPASWSDSLVSDRASNHIKNQTNGHTNGTNSHIANGNSYTSNKAIRTVFGLVPLDYALDWPVMASYDELATFASWSGGRIPSMEEVRSIYEHVDELKKQDFENSISKTIPAVNGHLINDGVEETPPYKHFADGASGTYTAPGDLFVNLERANVGFKHWHPMPVIQDGGRLAGQGEMGGAWEWTSSVLEEHNGFEAMELYPGYTADFFDKKHNIVLGGSWSTHPRIAGRKSFVNWYQRNYPYVWAGARLAKDV